MSTAVGVESPTFEISGPPGAPVVVALGGITAHRHVCATESDSSPGWWDTIAGRGRVLDTKRWRVFGVDFIDAGSDERGLPANVVTTHDQADAIAAALDCVGIERVHALIGASYGGMVALAFAERHAERVERLVVISAAHRSSPLTTARRIIQRRVVELGIASGNVTESLVIARALAMTTYRSAEDFERREDLGGIAAYLDHHGRKFAAHFAPERFLALSLSADLHSVDPRAIRAATTLVAAANDQVVPRDDLEELARLLGAPIVDLPGTHGHDAFLTEPVALGRILHDALRTNVS